MKCIACNKKLHRRKGIRVDEYYYCKECMDILNYEVKELYNTLFTCELVDGKAEVEVYEGETEW